MSKKKIAIIIGTVAVAAAAAVGVWYFASHLGKDSNDRVYVEKVSTIMGSATGAQNRYSGVVQPQKTIEVNTDSDRTVKEVYVKVGDTVEEGTPLFCYDTEELTMDLDQAKLELENEDVEISNYKSQIAELKKEKDAAAESDKFEYTTQIQTIETQIKQSEYEKSSKQLEIDKIQKKIDNSEVLSTASGVVKSVSDVNAQESTDSSAAFLTILSTGGFRVKGTVNEQNIGMISSGSAVIVRSRVDEELIWHGAIESIDTDDPSSSSEDDMMYDDSEESTAASTDYPFYVALEDAQGLMLGQHVLIELDEGQTEKKDGIWLFSSYIVFDEADGDMPEELEDLDEDTEMVEEVAEVLEEGTEDLEEGTETTEIQIAYVWADDGNGRLEKRTVELGEYDENLDEYEIVSGLSEDDLIAWPMDGLYEGIITVTNVDDIDYSSDLYNQEMGTEEMWMDTEEMWMDTEYMMDEEYMFEEEEMYLEDDALDDAEEVDAEVSE